MCEDEYLPKALGISEGVYGRKSTDCTEHENYVISFVFLATVFWQFRGLESQEMKYFLQMYDCPSEELLTCQPYQPFI